MEQRIFTFKGKGIINALKCFGQVLLIMCIFAMLYLFLIVGFALGFKM